MFGLFHPPRSNMFMVCKSIVLHITRNKGLGSHVRLKVLVLDHFFEFELWTRFAAKHIFEFWGYLSATGFREAAIDRLIHNHIANFKIMF